MSGLKGERSTGGGRSHYRHPAEEERFAEAVRSKRQWKNAPANLERRPIELPPMTPIKDAS